MVPRYIICCVLHQQLNTMDSVLTYISYTTANTCVRRRCVACTGQYLNIIAFYDWNLELRTTMAFRALLFSSSVPLISSCYTTANTCAGRRCVLIRNAFSRWNLELRTRIAIRELLFSSSQPLISSRYTTANPCAGRRCVSSTGQYLTETHFLFQMRNYGLEWHLGHFYSPVERR
jgi:hypothetical protein